MQTTAPARSRHRPWIADRIRAEHVEFRAVCGCGVLADWAADGKGKRAAQKVIRDHKAALKAALDPGQVCADPESHHTPDWEACPTCAGQTSIFDL